MTSEEKFFNLYKKEPLNVFCPYRVCPLGAHIDHQNGPILGFALDKGVHISFLESNSKKIELLSLNYPSIVEFSLLSIPEPIRVTGVIIYEELLSLLAKNIS